MKKHLLATSLCGILVTTNVITGWQFKQELATQKFEYEQVIENLHSLNEMYDEKIKLQQVNISELNTKLDDKEKRLIELSQKLKEIEAQPRDKELP